MITAASRLAEPEHRLTRGGRELRVRVVQIPDDIDGGHALIFGDITDGCLVRIHSRCLYGDALRSDDCDCGPELDLAMDMIQKEGRGILFYLEQEGRGAGLINKARGLRTSELYNIDTFDSYAQLELSADSRSYKLAADYLNALHLTSVRLLTNNPDKIRALNDAGVEVTVVNLHTWPRSERARKYLEAKRSRRGHMIPAYAALQAAVRRHLSELMAVLAVLTLAAPLAILGHVGTAIFSAVGGLVVFGVYGLSDRRR